MKKWKKHVLTANLVLAMTATSFAPAVWGTEPENIQVEDELLEYVPKAAEEENQSIVEFTAEQAETFAEMEETTEASVSVEMTAPKVNYEEEDAKITAEQTEEESESEVEPESEIESEYNYQYYSSDAIYLQHIGNNVWYAMKYGIKSEYTGLVLHEGSWYYVENGILNWGYTGLTYYYDTWYYVENGVLNWSYTGLAYHSGSWYYVEKGVLNWGYTGLTYYYGIWYYVENGVLNWGYTGLAYHSDAWYYVENGALNWDYTGLAQHNGGWYYVENGILNWNHSGPVEYYGTVYYVVNGYLDWSYQGTTYYLGKYHKIINGVVQKEALPDLKTLEAKMNAAKELADASGIQTASEADFLQYLMDNGYISDTDIRDGMNVVEFVTSLQGDREYIVGTIEQMQYAIEIIRNTNKVRVASGRTELLVDPIAMALSLEQFTYTSDTLMAGNGLQHHTMKEFANLGITSSSENISRGYIDPVKGWFTEEASSFAWYLIDNTDAVVWKNSVTDNQKAALVAELSGAETTKGSSGQIFDNELLYKMSSMVDVTASSRVYRADAMNQYGQIGHYKAIMEEDRTAMGSAGVTYHTTLERYEQCMANIDFDERDERAARHPSYGRYTYTAVENMVVGTFRNAGEYTQFTLTNFEALLSEYKAKLQANTDAYRTAKAEYEATLEAYNAAN